MRNVQRIAVVGGGVIGLATAWRVAATGRRVTVIDPTPVRGGGSWVAAGMLAPVTEAWLGEEHVLAFGAESLARWPGFAADLADPPGLRREGTLALALDAADAEDQRRLADFLSSLGREVRRLTARQVRELEPGTSPVRSGLLVPGDLSVDSRRLLRSLAAQATAEGVGFHTGRAVSVRDGGVELADGSTVECDEAVIAAGAWSRALHPALDTLVRPVKGEVLRLRSRPSALPPPTRTLRAHVESRPVYLVPRDGGELVVGATQHEVGHDTEVTVAGVRDLLTDAERVLPGVREYALVEAVAGLRAGSPDNLPLLGRLGPGVLVATGHHRNGVLMAPVTADAVVALLRGDTPPDHVLAAAPSRFPGAT
ncbi:glycine oxidase ThiO [Actinokineospora spheciospongiae]|uniref:glycine oxidase ThiO n=1 Tax=Actinokineospora spheciospongiae TaxID=909613 RepID=UPI00054DE743|nr:glycine oxidase ThiO [Actinokineospora spheciospongiae]PWW65798.1 glycine oxidase [Actinokineospora spheciospongiae]